MEQMNKTKIDFKRVLRRIDFWKRQEDILQKAMDKFTQAISPSSHPPIIEMNRIVDAFIEGISNGDKAMKIWLEYYAWEVDDKSEWECSQKTGKGIIKCKNASDKKLFGKFLNQLFNE